MGQFSWFSSDEKKRIVINEIKNIMMIGPNAKFLQETEYEGYGEFGGKDIYEYIAELNNLKTRDEAIDAVFAFNPTGALQTAESMGLIIPRLLTNSENFNKPYNLFPAPEPDPNQGFIEIDEDDEDYDFEDEFEEFYDENEENEIIEEDNYFED